MLPRHFLAAVTALAAVAACSPPDARTRLESSLSALQSATALDRRAEACDQFRTALAEYPSDAPDRDAFIHRAVPLLIGALSEPRTRPRAEEALVSVGLRSYEALFDAALEGTPSVQDGAVVCLVRMSGTAVPVLLPALLGEDVVAQDRAARVLTRMGEPISPTLQTYHRELLASIATAAPAGSPQADGGLSARGKAGLLALARVFAAIGDRTSILALLEGCDTLHRAHPDLGIAYLRLIQRIGPDALNQLPATSRLTYERLRLTIDTP